MKFIESNKIDWHNLSNLSSFQYTCAHCGNKVSSCTGYYFTAVTMHENGREMADGGYIYICPHCKNPTFIFKQQQIPGIPSVKSVDHLPASINEIYEEARKCMSAGCYTAAAMICRKILMNVAVEKGAAENSKFFQYVDYLDTNSIFPNGCKQAIEIIRSKGNEANHEIEQTSKEDASLIIKMTNIVLYYVYDVPGQMSISTI